ncbi:hypothetical protein CHLRE_03g204752v5 [Chlamydomonas reinhardtii]|uniref:mRNA (guanine-N(7))-methyltransferase n=1 Tax=Chlamydomonas reinhardtii TaxID=3055 RepID=A0A2K3DZ33_CHLRE|nr:uncharacterized protein CHLRE_03g204752v5 [Chlamydomonas reinhardtii]PNW85804.1 hypothetical protein CHLRE_03g204752v5 [Chlamydomonas reinhardtii]
MADHGGGTWEQQRQHYNSHVTNLSTQEALQARSEGPAQALKHFHNHVKRQLILRFAYKQERLLDMCCGRGGDLHKWKEAQIKYVKGLDISEREVEEAQRRYAEMEARRKGPPMHCEFAAVDWLGSRPYEDGGGAAGGPATGGYGVVACMFALHYFFVSEASLRCFLGNAAAQLRNGGFFLGTLPSGARVQELLGGRSELRLPMLRLKKRWADGPGGRPASPYGAGYICDIADTVTASKEGATEGSLEYLVDLQVLQQVAAEVGLFPVTDYHDAVVMANFEQEDVDAPFKRFKPFFLDSPQLDAPPGRPPPPPPSSLEMASSLFVAFVFQKTSGPEAVTVPMAPECSFMQPPAAGRRRGGGGGGGGPRDDGWGGGGGGGHGGPMGHDPGMMGMGPMGGGGHGGGYGGGGGYGDAGMGGHPGYGGGGGGGGYGGGGGGGAYGGGGGGYGGGGGGYGGGGGPPKRQRH